MRCAAVAASLAAAIIAIAGCGDDDESAPQREDSGTAVDLEASADEAGCELLLDLPDEIKPYVREHGTGHLEQDDPVPKYETTPPTSGPHRDFATVDGVYTKPQDPREVVHALEHGRVVVQYQPDLPAADQQALNDLYESDPAGLILFPNPDMPYDVAATAWTNLIGCDRYSPEALLAIAAFRDEFLGQGPEDIPL